MKYITKLATLETTLRAAAEAVAGAKSSREVLQYLQVIPSLDGTARLRATDAFMFLELSDVGSVEIQGDEISPSLLIKPIEVLNLISPLAKNKALKGAEVTFETQADGRITLLAPGLGATLCAPKGTNYPNCDLLSSGDFLVSREFHYYLSNEMYTKVSKISKLLGFVGYEILTRPGGHHNTARVSFIGGPGLVASPVVIVAPLRDPSN